MIAIIVCIVLLALTIGVPSIILARSNARIARDLEALHAQHPRHDGEEK